jgi:hypothetical protein
MKPTTLIDNAAIRYPDGTTYVGSRHADCIRQAAESGNHERTDKFDQGFMVMDLKSGGVTKRFVDRAEARGIAINNHQVPPTHGTLYSEDLWPIICPKCHGHAGYYEKWVEVRTYFYTFQGEGEGEADDPSAINGGKRKYCQECNADITKRLSREVI